MLEHTGRKSGLVRRTILEVVVNHPDAVYVAAAWGSKAQWLANLKAEPRSRIYLGSRSYETSAEMVSRDAAGEVMAEYAQRHPKALAKLAAFMLDEPASKAEGQAAQVADLVPIVRLRKEI